MNLKKRLIGGTVSVVALSTMLSLSAFAADYTLGSSENTREFATGITAGDNVYVENGYLLTMTVNGKETKYVPGQAYSGDVHFKATPSLGKIASVSNAGDNDYNYRTALFVNGSGLIDANSVFSAIASGTYNEDGAQNLLINATTPGFSGIIVENNNGASTKYYSISNSVLNLLTDSDGSDVCDFTLYGGAITGFGNVNLTLDNVTVNTEGVGKVAFGADNGADVLVKNSTFSVLGGTLYDGYYNNAAFSDMVAPPWVLGISGNARGTNLLGENSTTTFVDSDFTTTAWGVLSVDAGSNGVINCINTKLTNLSNTGYGSYVIGNAKETFYGTTFDVGTYPIIMTGGEVTFTSSIGIDSYDTVNGAGETVYNNYYSDRTDGVTTVESQFGVMSHNSGTITLEKGTVFNTKNAAFLVKNGAQTINVDNSTLNVEDGTILQMMDNDDATVGVNVALSTAENMFPIFNTVFNEATGYPTTAYESTDAASVSTANFTNVNLTGNMYNASGYLQNAKELEVTLGENATLKGAITASSSMHVEMKEGSDGRYEYVKDANGNYVQATTFTEDEYYNLGHVVNKAYFNGKNKVSVSLTDNAVWTVTDTSYLNKLVVGEDASVVGEMTVNGVVTKIEAGKTYEGTLVLSSKTTAATTVATATSITKSSVKTGDESQAILWGSVFTVVVLASGGYFFYNKKRAYNK